MQIVGQLAQRQQFRGGLGVFLRPDWACLRSPVLAHDPEFFKELGRFVVPSHCRLVFMCSIAKRLISRALTAAERNLAITWRHILYR